jgi:hypothetical protein
MYGEDAAEISVQSMNTAGYSADAVYSGGPALGLYTSASLLPESWPAEVIG